MTRLRTPIVVVITGEGGSGGALGLAVGDVVLALENSIYSVISPEGCASILWRSSDQSQAAAVAMKVTAGEQVELGVVDAVIPEPGEGAIRIRPRRPGWFVTSFSSGSTCLAGSRSTTSSRPFQALSGLRPIYRGRAAGGAARACRHHRQASRPADQADHAALPGTRRTGPSGREEV